jgi:NitT/TauT family transport system substrate-binding protein
MWQQSSKTAIARQIDAPPREVRRGLRAAGVGAAIALLIGACSSNSGSSSSSSTSPSAPSGVESSAASPTASESATTSPSAAQIEKAGLVLDWTWQPYHLPFMYGDSFKQNNVDLALTQGQGSGTSATLVGQNKYPFGFIDTATAIISQSKGVPIKNILVIQQSGAFATECWKSANVSSPADLKGKTVLIVPNESTAQVWPAYLSANKLDANDVKVQAATVANKVSLFVAHKADCMAGLLGQDTLQASLASADIAEPMPWSANGIQLFGYSLVASDDVIKNDPDLVKSVVKATIDSWKATCADQTAALDFFSKEHADLASTDADKSYNTGNLKAACDQTNPPAGVTSTPLGASSADQWNAVIDTLTKYGGLTGSKPATEYYTNDFIPTS